jgi:hypothetical protein
MHLFVDQDGVLADFDAHYFATFGIKCSKVDDNVDWRAVRLEKNFYAGIPQMPDMWTLWNFIAPFHPTILTGIPDSIAEEATRNKTEWAVRHIGSHVPIICCRSRDKSSYCQPGDVLIDDWDKYRDLWVAKGGTWITHRSAHETITDLKTMGLPRQLLRSAA